MSDSVVGAVVTVDRDSNIVRLTSDTGLAVVVKVDEHTSYLRLPAGEKTLVKAVPARLGEIVDGDRVLAHGRMSDDKKELQAQRLIVLTKADIQKKRERDIGEWQRRGISGVVKSVNPQTGEVSLETRGPGGLGQILIATNNCDFRRYAGGSAKYEDTRSSTFSEIQTGDQLRALGEKDPEGKTMRAEAMVSGSFRTIGALVTAADLRNHIITATTFGQKREVVISVTGASELHRIPPKLAALIAQQIIANKPAASAPQPSSNLTSAASTQKAGTAGTTQPSDIQQMIDALPALTIADIKPGDVIVVTSSIEKDSSQLTAIKLIAGIDGVLKAIPSSTGKNKTISLSAGLPSVFDFSVVQ